MIKTDNNYLYTAMGELQVDKSEDIEEIVWRVDSKIAEVRRTSQSQKRNLRFDYDAMGNRIAKHIYTDNTFTLLEKSAYYVRDASGNVMAVYDRIIDASEETSEFMLSERHIYGSSRIGMDVSTHGFGPDPYTALTETTRELGHKQYEISNHLGNVLSVITDQKLPVVDATLVVSYSAVVVTATDYSPFGVGLYGRSWSGEYRYGFNGKEIDSEGMGGGSSTYDYGFRIYNAQLGKFLSVDPLTPFQFASNTPIVAVDLDELEAVNHSQVSTQLGNGLISVVEQDDIFYLTHNYHGQLTTVLIEKYGDENADLKSWFGNYPITRSLYHMGNHHETWISAANAFGSELDKRYSSEAEYCPNSGALGVGSAFRHILGQAAITATYGEGFAKYSGDAHERANGRFGPLDADNIADLLNNEYGCQIGSIWLSAIGGDASKATRENVAGLMNTIAEYVVEATPELAGTDAPHFSEDDDVVTETHRHIVQMDGEN